MTYRFLWLSLLILMPGAVLAQSPPPATSLVTPTLEDCRPAHLGRSVCATCHRSGRYSDASPRAACAQCHRSPHRGQLENRADGGRCDACHDVLGFVPVSFGIEKHAQTRFPLDGAHRAVACNACHTRGIVRGAETVRLVFDSIECASCHTDIPPGHTRDVQGTYGCTDCHTTAGWRQVSFDHQRTDFPLQGRHAKIACQRCHPKVDEGTPRERVHYADLDRACSSCHETPHAGQFAGQRCDQCHSPEDWTPRRFDHQKNTSFALLGKHREAKCEQCHRVETTAEGKLVRRFKPMSTDCRACHGPDGAVLRVFSRGSALPRMGTP